MKVASTVAMTTSSALKRMQVATTTSSALKRMQVAMTTSSALKRMQVATTTFSALKRMRIAELVGEVNNFLQKSKICQATRPSHSSKSLRNVKLYFGQTILAIILS